MRTQVNFALTLLLSVCTLPLAAQEEPTPFTPGPLTLTYDHPADPTHWATEGLPIGNGRLGAMLFGGVTTERIQFNEISLWGGVNNWDGGFNMSDTGFGGYRNFGDLWITWGGVDLHTVAKLAKNTPADYRMSLDLPTGIQRVAFTNSQNAKMTREAFVSKPDQVMVFHYAADKKGALTGNLRLKPGQGKAVLKTDKNGISFSGVMANKLRYAAALRVLHQGGQVTTEGDTLVFTNCDSLTLLLDARTDYKPSFKDGWRGADPQPLLEKEIAAAASKPLASLRTAHLADFSKLMGACQINLGTSSAAQLALTTPERLRLYVDGGDFKSGGDDPGLEAQIFQMGRYLLASSSRPGTLPANLQGLWNDRNNPDWASDYHTNINLQMNYWPAETTHLGECALPLMDFIQAQAPACRLAAQRAFGKQVRGWTARTSQSPFGGNAWNWNIPSSAWFALHVFDHWDFNRDDAYLKNTAYPILKEICQYWEDRLKKLPDGTLVAPKGWSPEHGPVEDGVMHDQQIIWELFDDYLKAAKALGVDADYQAKVADMQAHLAPNKIGKWGQLQEWQVDRDDANNRHRHTSHLFALFPGRQISKTATPELAQAAKVSLLARSNDQSEKTGVPWTPANMDAASIYGWVWPWRAAMWARLGEGDRAHALVWGKAGNTAPNLMGLNLPYFKHRQELIQLDNSFGYTAAVAEMLLQSHAGEIHLLPALPKIWAKKGSFTGLRARGNFTVSCTWQDGQITSGTITGKPGAVVKLLVGETMKQVTLPPSGELKWD